MGPTRSWKHAYPTGPFIYIYICLWLEFQKTDAATQWIIWVLGVPGPICLMFSLSPTQLSFPRNLFVGILSLKIVSKMHSNSCFFPYLDCIELSLKPLLANLLDMGWKYRLSPDERTKFRCTHLLDPPFSTINCEGFTAWPSSRQDVSALGRSEYNQYEPPWALAGQTGVYDLVNIHKAIENGHL